MINSVSSTHASQAPQAAQAAPKTQAQPQPQKSSSLPQDTVSLKSTGDVDHDGDSK
jgi:hypothetical protein